MNNKIEIFTGPTLDQVVENVNKWLEEQDDESGAENSDCRFNIISLQELYPDHAKGNEQYGLIIHYTK